MQEIKILILLIFPSFYLDKRISSRHLKSLDHSKTCERVIKNGPTKSKRRLPEIPKNIYILESAHIEIYLFLIIIPNYAYIMCNIGVEV